jgi:hypothetical protein
VPTAARTRARYLAFLGDTLLASTEIFERLVRRSQVTRSVAARVLRFCWAAVVASGVPEGPAEGVRVSLLQAPAETTRPARRTVQWFSSLASPERKWVESCLRW